MTERYNTSTDEERHVPDRIPGEALGQSEAFLAFQERLSLVSKVNRPVLLLGERGTGKELAASRLHYLSPRWEEPFIALNCAALPSTLIESELFGHEAGSFTGATGRRLGRFETANGGTLFLDEIGNIPIEAQEKILRVVEYGSFERVGGSKAISVDVRIVAATNSDLPAMATAGKFKEDLLDRLSFEVIYLPPLRERIEDIMLLANHFAARMAFELGSNEMPEFSENAVTTLENYSWPGNIRELKNVIERATYRSNMAVIDDIIFDPFQSPYRQTPEHVILEAPPPLSPAVSASPSDKSFKDSVQELELRLLNEALERTRFNQRDAAKLLKLSYHQFRGLYRKYQDTLNSETCSDN